MASMEDRLGGLRDRHETSIANIVARRNALIRAAHDKDGLSYYRIAKLTGYGREWIQRICEGNDDEPNG